MIHSPKDTLEHTQCLELILYYSKNFLQSVSDVHDIQLIKKYGMGKRRNTCSLTEMPLLRDQLYLTLIFK